MTAEDIIKKLDPTIHKCEDCGGSFTSDESNCMSEGMKLCGQCGEYFYESIMREAMINSKNSIRKSEGVKSCQ